MHDLAKKLSQIYTRLTGDTEGADDCAQEILCRMLEGKHQRSSLKHAVIDYLRATRGRKSEKREVVREISAHEFVAHFPTEHVRVSAESALKELQKANTLDRIAFLLHAKWGLERFEIAEVMGASVARVDQRLRRVRELLRGKVGEVQEHEG